MTFDPTTLALYPEEPGVYLMKDAAGTILYVGKAKNLRSRIKSYYSTGRNEREMVPYLIAQVATIDSIVALTEKDALILENTLIKRHQPKYNVLLKDDKTFVSLMLSKHKWPILRLVRYKGKPKDDGLYFGPYTNALAARQTYDLLLRLFPLRQCSDVELASRERPCLLYEIKRCCAPCVGKCTPEEYQEYVDGVKKLLKGHDKELIRTLKQEMEAASEALQFEKASAIHQTIQQIEHVTSVCHVDNPHAEDCDSVGLYREADAVLIAILEFREGKVIGSEHFSFHRIASSDEELLESFLLQRYKQATTLPKNLFVPIALSDSVADILSEAKQENISIVVPKLGRKRDLLEMAYRNAKALFVREQDARSLREKQLLDLQETLGLLRFPRKILCFDTSNMAGTDPVAALVCFVHGQKDSSRMRLFKIRGQSDDYSAMREVLLRHFTKEKASGELSDLVIVDGGKGQLNIVLDVFAELSIASIDAMGLAKEDARHDKGLTRESIYLPHRKDPLLIDPHSPLLFLLQTIRDEAHRVAISYHRKKRSQRSLSSELDELPGIGPVKKRRLLQRFGSLAAIRRATDEELLSVRGIQVKDLAVLRKKPPG